MVESNIKTPTAAAPLRHSTDNPNTAELHPQTMLAIQDTEEHSHNNQGTYLNLNIAIFMDRIVRSILVVCMGIQVSHRLLGRVGMVVVRRSMGDSRGVGGGRFVM